MAALAQMRHDALHVARVDQRAFGEPLVIDDAELLEVGPNVVDSRVSGEREDPFVALVPEQGSGTSDQGVDVGFLVAPGRLVGRHCVHKRHNVDREVPADITLEGSRNLVNVRTAIAVRGKFNRRSATLQVPQPHAQREDVHLTAGVVDVVLALDVEPGRFEDVRNAGSVRCTPAVPDVKGPGGIGGDELHLNAPATTEIRIRLARAGDEDLAHRRGERRRRDAEVDEAGTGDVDRRDRGRLGQPRHDALGDLARLAPCDSGEGEGERAREVAVVVTAAAFDRDVGQRIERELAFVAKCRQRVLEERADMLLHGLDALRFNGKIVWAPARLPGDGGLESGAGARAAHSTRIDHRQDHGLADPVAEGSRCRLSHNRVTGVDRLAAERHGFRVIEHDGGDARLAVLEVAERVQRPGASRLRDPRGLRPRQGEHRVRLGLVGERHRLPGGQMPREPGQVALDRRGADVEPVLLVVEPLRDQVAFDAAAPVQHEGIGGPPRGT